MPKNGKKQKSGKRAILKKIPLLYVLFFFPNPRQVAAHNPVLQQTIRQPSVGLPHDWHLIVFQPFLHSTSSMVVARISSA
eukprot:1785831-Amphidinium_carterae.1